MSKNGKSGMGCGTLLVVSCIFAAIMVTCLRQGGGRRVPVAPSPSVRKQVAEPYPAEIRGRRDISVGGKSRLVHELYLKTTGVPDEHRMRETAIRAWESGNQHWSEFTVFMIFGEIENFNAGAYGIAEFTPSGLKEFRLNDVPLRMLELKKLNLSEDG